MLSKHVGCIKMRWCLIGLLLCLSVQGCVVSLKGKGETSHHIIIGIGLVSVKDEPSAVLTTNTQSLGLSISDRPGLKVGFGYSSNIVVSVPDSVQDVRVEVSSLPGRPFIVETQSAVLKLAQEENDK